MLTSYFRNNVLHLMLLPSLVACAFLNNATMRAADLQRLAWRIYPYVARGVFPALARGRSSRGGGRRTARGPAAITACSSRDGGSHRVAPPAGRVAAKPCSCRCSRTCTVPIIERYYLAISLLLKAGSGRTQPGSARTPVPADGAAHVAAVRAELAGVLRPCAVRQFHRSAARPQAYCGAAPKAGSAHEHAVLEAVADDAQLVLHEQIRNSILQVVHR